LLPVLIRLSTALSRVLASGISTLTQQCKLADSPSLPSTPVCTIARIDMARCM
jgi:hypothetical protein